jgi:hypothetical protein
MEQYDTMEGYQKIILEDKKMLLVFDDEIYDSLILTEANERFIFMEVSGGIPKETVILHYTVQIEDKLDINLN